MWHTVLLILTLRQVHDGLYGLLVFYWIEIVWVLIRESLEQHIILLYNVQLWKTIRMLNIAPVSFYLFYFILFFVCLQVMKKTWCMTCCKISSSFSLLFLNVFYYNYLLSDDLILDFRFKLHPSWFRLRSLFRYSFGKKILVHTKILQYQKQLTIVILIPKIIVIISFWRYY